MKSIETFGLWWFERFAHYIPDGSVARFFEQIAAMSAEGD
jgi:hypothetical protein